MRKNIGHQNVLQYTFKSTETQNYWYKRISKKKTTDRPATESTNLTSWRVMFSYSKTQPRSGAVDLGKTWMTTMYCLLVMLAIGSHGLLSMLCRLLCKPWFPRLSSCWTDWYFSFWCTNCYYMAMYWVSSLASSGASQASDRSHSNDTWELLLVPSCSVLRPINTQYIIFPNEAAFTGSSLWSWQCQR